MTAKVKQPFRGENWSADENFTWKPGTANLNLKSNWKIFSVSSVVLQLLKNVWLLFVTASMAKCSKNDRRLTVKSLCLNETPNWTGVICIKVSENISFSAIVTGLAIAKIFLNHAISKCEGLYMRRLYPVLLELMWQTVLHIHGYLSCCF